MSFGRTSCISWSVLDMYGVKIDKYEYLKGEEILPSNQKQIIEQAKFTYYLLHKAF